MCFIVLIGMPVCVWRWKHGYILQMLVEISYQSMYWDRDEELLARGLELNDSLQNLLAKHDAIAAGSPLPSQVTNVSPEHTETSASSLKQSEVRDSSPKDLSPRPNASSAPTTTLTASQIYEEEEDEDEFAQLARRLLTNHVY